MAYSQPRRPATTFRAEFDKKSAPVLSRDRFYIDTSVAKFGISERRIP